MFLNTVWRQLKAEAYTCASCSKTIYISTKRYLKNVNWLLFRKKKKKKKKHILAFTLWKHSFLWAIIYKPWFEQKAQPLAPTPRKSNGRPQSKT